MKKPVFILLTVLFAIFFINTFHEEYPDEYDSITGGKFITEFKVPYKDWFQHHQPGAYALAAMILPFSGQSFVRFRIGLSVLFFIINIGSFLLIRSRLKTKRTEFYLLYLFYLAFGMTYFWGEMLLADTLAAYLIIPAFAYLLLKEYHGENFNHSDLMIISIYTFLTWFTSMTYLYVVFGLTTYAVYLYCKQGIKDGKKLLKNVRRALFIILLPYTVFFVFFLLTGGLKDYYFANITYNQNYYIYNYPHSPGAPINPIRYAVVIANTFLNNYIPAVSAVSFLNFLEPFQITLALSSVLLTALLIIRKKWSFIALYWLILIFSNARSNPQNIKETDYQATTYILVSLFSGLFAMQYFQEICDTVKEKLSLRIFSGLAMLLLITLYTASGIYLFQQFTRKYYPKYMGTMPLIYDRPEIAPLVSQIVGKNDYVYIGPFEFKELFYLTSGKMPTKYHWFLQHAAVSKIKDELLSDFKKNRPMLIVFKRSYAPWGGDAHQFNYFVTDFLDKEYFRLYMLNSVSTDYNYKWKISNTAHFDIDGDFNFDKNRQDEILRKLIELKLIEKIPKTKI